MNSLVLVRTFPNHALARIAADRLAQDDIIAHVEGADRVSALGVEAVSIRVLVAPEDLGRARAALDARDDDGAFDEGGPPTVASAAAAARGIDTVPKDVAHLGVRREAGGIHRYKSEHERGER